MTDQQKYILLGLLAAGGVGYWYFFYGPGMTQPATATASAASPAAVVPAPANGSTVPVPAIVQGFVNSWGPNSQALWNTVIPKLSAASVTAQYTNLSAVLPYWNSNTVAPAALSTAVDTWFNQNGFTNLST